MNTWTRDLCKVQDGRSSDCSSTTGTNCLAVRWPGWRTNPWHQDANAPDIVTWAGGLVDGMRDESGQQYMRNRYYDPATGQFTQPDPIGLAGGLNSYGFAAGDPVSYSDPYGLCPESMRIAGDKCPGGLDTEQWNSVQEGAETLSDTERAGVLDRLFGGGYSAADIGTSNVAHTVWDWAGVNDQVVLNTNPASSFFQYRQEDRGWVLSHEQGHVLQNAGSQADRRVLWTITSLQTRAGPLQLMGSLYQGGLERNADQHACANANPVVFAGRCQ